uniref:Uncharacterized protein n=1 Tax=viral metagenome TaxID=1070528 RepID=A0A6C0I2C3_9ZZZZ
MEQGFDTSDSESDTSDSESDTSDTEITSYFPHSTIMNRNWLPYRSGDCSLSFRIPNTKMSNAYDKNGIEINPPKKGFPYIINGHRVWVRALSTERYNEETEYSLQVLVYNRINNHYGWSSARPSSTDPEILTVCTSGPIWKQLGEMVDNIP